MHAVWSAGAGLPYLEPAFATVAQAPGREVHGLACAVTAQQWARIQLTEAGYDAVEVRCEGYGGSRALLARTLVFPAQRRRKGLRPSRRYAACPLSLASRLYRASLRQETAPRCPYAMARRVLRGWLMMMWSCQRERARVGLVDSHGRWRRPCLQTAHMAI
jgi:hypothetical protein